MKPIDDLTPGELRREIAKRLGWKIESKPDGKFFVTHNGAVCFGGKEWKSRAWTEARLFNALPDWPGDLGAALELCSTLITSRRSILINENDVCWDEGDLTCYGYEVYSRADPTSLALALSRLALTALRGE